MIKLKSLIAESASLKEGDLANIIKNAYISIFDIDEVEVIKAKNLRPPSFVYTYMTVSASIVYNKNRFLNYHKLFHYKFPKEETKGLSSEEWRAMLVQAEQFPPLVTTHDLIKGENNLIIFNSSVNEANKNGGEITGFEMYNDLNHLGDVEDKHNIGDLIKSVKAIIDKYGDSDNKNSDEISPITSPTDRKLVPA